MVRALVLAISVAACRPPSPVEVAATPAAGISIALYQLGDQGYSVIDDRRWVEITGGTLVLDRLDPGAALPTLVIEPLGGSSLVAGACSRDVVVRCAMTGPRGKHLVRVLYISNTLGYQAQHALAMSAPERATLTTRYAIATPAWGGTAEVALFDGMPGREQAPIEIARGTVALDGTTAILATPSRELPAQLRRIYNGEGFDPDVDDEDEDLAFDTEHAVWVWLELALARLAPGPLHASIDVPGETAHDVDVPAVGRVQGASAIRLPLWVDPALRGTRTRRRTSQHDADVAEWFALTIANLGPVAREVWIEQRLQPAKRRVVTMGKPTKPVLGRDRARSKVTVQPGDEARVSYAIAYTF